MMCFINCLTYRSLGAERRRHRRRLQFPQEAAGRRQGGAERTPLWGPRFRAARVDETAGVSMATWSSTTSPEHHWDEV